MMRRVHDAAVTVLGVNAVWWIALTLPRAIERAGLAAVAATSVAVLLGVAFGLVGWAVAVSRRWAAWGATALGLVAAGVAATGVRGWPDLLTIVLGVVAAGLSLALAVVRTPTPPA